MLLWPTYMIMNSSSFINTPTEDSSQRWAGTHFDWLCWSIHGSGRMCPGSAGSQLRPSDMNSSRQTFMLGVLRPASLNLRGLSPQALTLLRGARFITWYLRRPFLEECWQGPRHFWSHQKYLGYGPAPRPT